MNYNPEDIIPGHILIVTILGCVAIALFVALIAIILIKFLRIKRGYSPRYYSIVQQYLLKTKFTYTLVKQDGNHPYLIKVNYRCFNTIITYHMYIPKNKDYLKTAKEEVRRLILDNTLCIYTLRIIPPKEFTEYYAAC